MVWGWTSIKHPNSKQSQEFWRSIHGSPQVWLTVTNTVSKCQDWISLMIALFFLIRRYHCCMPGPQRGTLGCKARAYTPVFRAKIYQKRGKTVANCHKPWKSMKYGGAFFPDTPTSLEHMKCIMGLCLSNGDLMWCRWFISNPQFCYQVSMVRIGTGRNRSKRGHGKIIPNSSAYSKSKNLVSLSYSNPIPELSPDPPNPPPMTFLMANGSLIIWGRMTGRWDKDG